MNYFVIEIHFAGNEHPAIPPVRGKDFVIVVQGKDLGRTIQEYSERFTVDQGVRMTITRKDWDKVQADAFLSTVSFWGDHG